MDTFRKNQNARVGIGGLKCYCCNYYRNKRKSLLNRMVRRTMKFSLTDYEK